ncbi:MAG: hypothetical protein KAT68_17135 [Bacteroidales bacterium]|jgi:hypothetical protein|nr:hypothetical protein [Bacteroidales bacterium]
MKKIIIRLIVKSASRIGENFHWEGLVRKGLNLQEFMDKMAKENTFITKNVYNLKSERLYPYHILFVNNELIMPKNFETFVFKTETKIRIIPFVSGG